MHHFRNGALEILFPFAKNCPNFAMTYYAPRFLKKRFEF